MGNKIFVVLNEWWFNCLNSCHCLGIIQVKTNENEIKYYIGIGDGFNKEEDIKRIIEYGDLLNPKDLLK